MERRIVTVDRYKEIGRRLREGRAVRKITRTLGCSRRLIREIRAGPKGSPDAPRVLAHPLWMGQLEWPAIIHDLGLVG